MNLEFNAAEIFDVQDEHTEAYDQFGAFIMADRMVRLHHENGSPEGEMSEWFYARECAHVELSDSLLELCRTPEVNVPLDS